LALGLAGLPAQSRFRVALLFAGFEAAMPLIGVALGAPLGHAIGSGAAFLAAGLLVALGIYVLLARDDDAEHAERLVSLTQRGLAAAVALGLSISLDELAIGFSAGLLRLPLLPTVVAIGLQAFVIAQIGLGLGSRVGARAREAVEKLAGAALLALGVLLLVDRVAA
jgi:putative Mn2+ efflux pump MntP